jgi:hypothetical protein
MAVSMPFATVTVKQLRFQFVAGGFAGKKKGTRRCPFCLMLYDDAIIRRAHNIAAQPLSARRGFS